MQLSMRLMHVGDAGIGQPQRPIPQRFRRREATMETGTLVVTLQSLDVRGKPLPAKSECGQAGKPCQERFQ